MFSEQQAFEKAINANPLEATNHHVYADWLEENGQHDEAAFRRAMGEWVQKHRATPLDSGGSMIGLEHPDSPYWGYSYTPNDEFHWRIPSNQSKATPDGVNLYAIPFHDPDRREAQTVEPHTAYYDWNHNTYNWKEYRHMEEAFRRAFTPPRRNYRRPLSRLKFFRK